MPRHLEDVPHLGSQWNEARGFQRAFARDPVMQERLMKVLIGLTRHYEIGPLTKERAAKIDALNAVILDLTVEFPEFITEGEIDGDAGGGYYKPDEQLLSAIHDIMSDPRNVATHERI